MPDYVVKGRKRNAHTSVNVTARSREEAIAQVVAQAAPGEEMEVMQVEEIAAGPTGTTGTTGPTGTSGASGTR